LGIAFISLRAGGVPQIVENILTKATNLFEISPQSEVCTQSYRLPKLRESPFKEFWDSNLGVLGQNDI
jgi:hypothetical protein